jgi:antitoxin CptB
MSELNKLRWRCRRGSLELDLILSRYLDTRYVSAARQEQQAFVGLLDLEDPELLQYLLGEDVPEDIESTKLIDILRLTPK